MKYLLDTHVIYWSLRGSSSLPDQVTRILTEEDCLISIASLWEMSIKSALGKLDLNRSCRQIAQTFTNIGIPLLEVTPDDCDEMRSLPFIHKDPFDRILIAQARNNGLTIVTRDSIIPRYDVPTVWE